MRARAALTDPSCAAFVRSSVPTRAHTASDHGLVRPAGRLKSSVSLTRRSVALSSKGVGVRKARRSRADALVVRRTSGHKQAQEVSFRVWHSMGNSNGDALVVAGTRDERVSNGGNAKRREW